METTEPGSLGVAMAAVGILLSLNLFLIGRSVDMLRRSVGDLREMGWAGFRSGLARFQFGSGSPVSRAQWGAPIVIYLETAGGALTFVGLGISSVIFFGWLMVFLGNISVAVTSPSNVIFNGATLASITMAIGLSGVAIQYIGSAMRPFVIRE